MNRSVVFLLIVAMLVVGWKQQEKIMSWLQPLSAAATTAASTVTNNTGSTAQPPDVLYHSVDKQGVSQFTQEPGKGRKAVIYDGSKTTVIKAVRAPAVVPVDDSKPAGNELMSLRNELEQNARVMSENKNAQRGL